MRIIVLLIIIFSSLEVFGQTIDDTLIGMVDQQLIKINKNNGGISAPQAITGIPSGTNPIRLTWCEPNQCYYTLSATYPPVLSKIDANGNYTTLGQLTYPTGTLYMCEGLGFNRANGELYASASLNGDPNSNPPDFFSEVLLRIDTTTLSTTLIGTFNTQIPTISEADNLTFDDNGMLYFYDGQPGQLNRFFMQDLSFTNAPIQIFSAPYEAVADLTFKDDDLYFSQNRILRKINIPTLTFSNVGALFTSAQFNGQTIRGITWRNDCPPADLLGNDTTICNGQLLTLTPSITGTSYLWQDGSTNATLNVTSSGNYWVEVLNGTCTYVDSMEVIIESTPTVDLGNDTSICSGNSIVLQAPANADSYLWQDGSSNSSFTVNLPGSYSVEVTSNGCATSDQINVSLEDLPNISLGPDRVLCIGESTLLSIDNTNASFTWSNGSSEPSILTDGDGIYWVQMTNDCGSASDSIIIESEECFCEMYIPNSFTPNGNEFNEDFGPEIDCPIFDYRFEIYNRWGELIFKSFDPNIRWDATYKGIPVQDGTYTYKVIYSSEDFIGKTYIGHVSVIR